MPTSFLHRDNELPPDDTLEDIAVLHCKACGAPMALKAFTRQASDDGVCELRDYECKNCGMLATIKREDAVPP